MSPSEAFDLFLDYCHDTHIDRGYCGALLSPKVTPYGDAPTPVYMMLDQYNGLVQLGPVEKEIKCARWKWRNHQRKPFKTNSFMLLHWPALIRNAGELVYTNPVLAVFLLTFKDTIQQYSPFLLESLQRKYVQDIYKLPGSRDDTGANIYASTDISTSVSPDVEGVVLQDLLNSASKDVNFIGELLRCCSIHYSGMLRAKERYSLGHTIVSKEKVPKDTLDACSRLYLDDTSRCAHSFETLEPKLLHKLCGGHLTPMLREFWVAYHLAIPWNNRPGWQKPYFESVVKQLGVAVLPGEPDLLLINWERWFNYRKSVFQHGPYRDFTYTSGSRKMERSARKFLKALREEVNPKMHEHMARAFALKYPGLRFNPVALSTSVTNTMKKTWDMAEDDLVNAMSVVDTGALRQISMNNNKRVFKKLELGAVRSSSHAYVLPESPSCVVTVEVGGETKYTFRVIHTGRKMYFQPSWDVYPSVCFKRPNYENEHELWHATNLRHGVTVLPNGEGPAYSYELLTSKHVKSGTPQYPEVLEALQKYADFSRSQFRSFISPRRLPLHWTEVEDAAIIKYYRPKRSTEDTENLMAACPTRTMNSISNRARVLRAKLIKSRVFDIDKLPHGQYNATIGKAIAVEMAKYPRGDY